MEATKPSPSTVEGKKGGPSKLMCLKVLLSVEGLVDLRIPRCKYSFTASSFSPLIDQEAKRGGALEPNTSTLDFYGLRWYLHFLACWATVSIMDCRSSGEEAIRARSSAYIGAPQKMLPIFTPSPDCSSSTRRSLTNKL